MVAGFLRQVSVCVLCIRDRIIIQNGAMTVMDLRQRLELSWSQSVLWISAQQPAGNSSTAVNQSVQSNKQHLCLIPKFNRAWLGPVLATQRLPELIAAVVDDAYDPTGSVAACLRSIFLLWSKENMWTLHQVAQCNRFLIWYTLCRLPVVKTYEWRTFELRSLPTHGKSTQTKQKWPKMSKLTKSGG